MDGYVIIVMIFGILILVNFSQYSNEYASNIITGIILFFILGSEFFVNYKFVKHSHKEEA